MAGIAAASPITLSFSSPKLSSFTNHSSSVSFVSPVFRTTLHILRPSSRCPRALAAVENDIKVDNLVNDEVADVENGEGSGVDESSKLRPQPCELYVCNLPTSVEISELLDMFIPFGQVNSVEISRDAETGLSRGCGYVTMNSLQEAKVAISALDKSDLGGREMHVNFSANASRRKSDSSLKALPKSDVIFESPHKIYVGNLDWSVKPEDLREYFSQYGTVVSTRLLFDRKGGKNRVYGFLSFSSADELKKALGAAGLIFHGRNLLVREVVKRV